MEWSICEVLQYRWTEHNKLLTCFVNARTNKHETVNYLGGSDGIDKADLKVKPSNLRLYHNSSRMLKPLKLSPK